MDYLEIFNTKFQELLNDLSLIFPNDSDLSLFKNTFQLIKATGPMTVCGVFHSHVAVPFEDQIMKQDEAFFLEQNYNEYKTADNADYIITKLKGTWGDLSEQNKTAVWKYFKVLLVLSKKCHE